MTIHSILVPVAALVAGVLLGSSLLREDGDVTELRKLVIVDAAGRPRIVLGSHDGGEPGVWVLDEEERPRIGLHCEPGTEERDGSSSISLHGSNGRPLISMEIGHDEHHGASAELAFYWGDEARRPYMTLGKAGAFADIGGALRFWGPDPAPFMSLEAGRVGGGPHLLLRSNNVHERHDPQRLIYLGMNQLQDRLTAIFQAGGARVDMRIDEHGEPSVDLEKDGAARTIAID
jgi:hypothetical protein